MGEFKGRKSFKEDTANIQPEGDQNREDKYESFCEKSWIHWVLEEEIV